MDDATVPDVDLWRFDEAFARAGMKGWQMPYHAGLKPGIAAVH
jgi:hypothetical protein